MFKKLVLLIVIVLSAISLPARAAFWNNDDITMLVMPRELLPLQIAQDISRRYPVLIVSYHLSLGELKIYAWNGDSWIRVSTDDYAKGAFFANRPKSAIVVENERFHAPAEMIPNSTWCGNANRISSTDPRALLHLLGLQFDFPYRHWNQMAKRYGYELEEINPTLQNVHWWNLRADTLLEKRAKRNFTVDLDKWHDVASLPPPAIEEPVAKPAPMPIVKPAVSEPTGATAVDITAKAPETKKAEKAPAVKPAPKKAAPEPAAKAKPVPATKPTPAPKPAPASEPAPAPAVEMTPPAAEKPAPAIEPAQAAPEPVATETAAPAVKEAESAAVSADPFSSDEIPAAEIVVPPAPKKPWWKF